MNISNINFFTTKKIPNKNAQNPISFRGQLKDDTFETTQTAPKKKTRAQILADKHAREVAFYNEKLEANPRTAFLYNPDLSAKQKDEILSESDGIYTLRDFSKQSGISSSVLDAWAKGGYLSFDETSDCIYVDAKFPQNENFINSVKENYKNVKTASSLVSALTIPESTMKRHIKSGTIKPVGFDEPPKVVARSDDFLIDMDDETNISTLSVYHKRPKASEKYLKGTGQPLVPVFYLQKLGYGNAKDLARMVQKGSLNGKLEKVDTKPGEKPKYRAYVDVSGYVRGEELLRDLRGKNPNAASMSDFAKEAKITVREVKEATVNGEVEIIDEYIFADDKDEILIDKTNPKNIKFMDKKFFERQALKAQRAQEAAERRKNITDPMQSLRMTLVWHMCPNTAKIASNVAQNDAQASAIIAKKEGGEELNDAEDRKYRSYCKKFWNLAGAAEFEDAHARATEILEQFKKQGLDGVDDEDARKIIEDFMQETGISF